jgi:hypothetical protein
MATPSLHVTYNITLDADIVPKKCWFSRIKMGKTTASWSRCTMGRMDAALFRVTEDHSELVSSQTRPKAQCISKRCSCEQIERSQMVAFQLDHIDGQEW